MTVPYKNYEHLHFALLTLIQNGYEVLGVTDEEVEYEYARQGSTEDDKQLVEDR